MQPLALAALGAISTLALIPPAAAATGTTLPTYIPHASAPGSAPLPFSDAVLAGDTLYVAGHIGVDAHTGNVPADADSEAQEVMDAVKHTVEAAGLTMDDLVSVTVYCTDLALYDKFNAVYRSFFHGHYPARAFIGADRLVRGAHFEVMGVAVRAAPHR
jgi:2-iminobutanoate/2-iminopropanoate deaminase